MIGAPAGQPEFAEWARLLGGDGAAIPFLRYRPERLSPLGARVEAALREQLHEGPSFVAFEGYDTVAVLADVLRSQGTERARIAESWPRDAVEGTRGPIKFARTPGISVWQWAWAPIQVVDRDPAEPGRFRILHADLAFDLSVLNPAGAVSFTCHFDLTLAAVPEGTRLRLGLRITDSSVEAAPYIAGIGPGWDQVLGNLAGIVDKSNRTPKGTERRS